MQQKWAAWRSMPHTRLWGEADWQYALDTAELAAAAFQKGAKVGLLAELRFREKQMGTTWSARQDMHIRYTAPPEESTPASMTSLEQYRDPSASCKTSATSSLNHPVNSVPAPPRRATPRPSHRPRNITHWEPRVPSRLHHS